jgi:hypothetical protein
MHNLPNDNVYRIGCTNNNIIQCYQLWRGISESPSTSNVASNALIPRTHAFQEQLSVVLTTQSWQRLVIRYAHGCNKSRTIALTLSVARASIGFASYTRRRLHNYRNWILASTNPWITSIQPVIALVSYLSQTV